MLEIMQGLATFIASERDTLHIDLDAILKWVTRRNEQLKATRKQLRWEEKNLICTKDRVFELGYNSALLKSQSSGLDHKQLLEPVMDDSVGKPALADEKLVVSFYALKIQ